MDVLTDLLERSRAHGAAFSHSTVYGEWGLVLPPSPGLIVHVFVAGEGHLWTSRCADPLRLQPGDMVLVRGELGHRIASSPFGPCRTLAEYRSDGAVAGSSRRLVHGDPADGPKAEFCCGAYVFGGDLCDGLLQALPDRVLVRPSASSALKGTGDLLAREMLNDQVGQQTVLDRLLDVALVQLVREHFATAPATAPAWLSASADPAIGLALRALHAAPEEPWTVAKLADEAALSRAAFARRFHELLGEAPLSYLTAWRMALARERLRNSDDRLAAIAAAVGYASEFSFAAAFKRAHGIAPGRWRAQARGREAQAA